MTASAILVTILCPHVSDIHAARNRRLLDRRI
jgi:hypothetical protein